MNAGTEIKTYKSPRKYQRDASKMASHGWSVANVVEHQRKTGLLRFAMLGGIGALVFKKRDLVVTYQRAA